MSTTSTAVGCRLGRGGVIKPSAPERQSWLAGTISGYHVTMLITHSNSAVKSENQHKVPLAQAGTVLGANRAGPGRLTPPP